MPKESRIFFVVEAGELWSTAQVRLIRKVPKFWLSLCDTSTCTTKQA
jgi:hypothetical protein